MEIQKGTLYIVATPIGNLEDITLRAVCALRGVDWIAAEDTRRTLKLLNHFDIKKKLVSFHEHSDAARLESILAELEAGASVALVSDAGTPVISDPGYILVKRCAERGIPVESLPGPCAAVTAVTLSAIDCGKFIFAGFLPAKSAARKAELERLKAAGLPAVFYESPNRLLKTLADVCAAWGGEARVCVARELTKLHEEVFRGAAKEAADAFGAREVKGEIVMVVDAAEERAFTDGEIDDMLRAALAEGHTKKEAVTIVTARVSGSRNKIYNHMIKLTK